MTDGRVDQVTVAGALRLAGQRTGILEAQVGRWVYVLPMAPATPPPSWAPADPLSPSFQNGWTNVAGKQPLSFRLHPATKVSIRGAVDNGTIPSVVFTLPDTFRPKNVVPISFPSADSTVEYGGRIDPNGDVSIIGVIAGPGAPTTTGREQFYGNNVLIPDASNVPLTWDNVLIGSPLLDLSVPATPANITAGIYTFSVSVSAADPITIGGYYNVILDLNSGGENAALLTTSPPATAANQQPFVALSNTYYLPAGALIIVTVQNRDGASAVNYALGQSIVQRIS